MDTIRHIPLSDMSNTLPDQCEDWLVRFYTRGNEKEFENLSKLFTLWREKHINESEICESASPKRRRTYTFPPKRQFSSADLESGLL